MMITANAEAQKMIASQKKRAKMAITAQKTRWHETYS
jgi:hypothetical protein